MKTLQQIADVAYNDILTLQARLDDARTLFRSIGKIADEGSLLAKLSLMGDESCEEWIGHAQVWMERMDEEIAALAGHTVAEPQNQDHQLCGAGGAA